jgi:PQQ-dependent catabolism-associated CXXCW motif protein
MTAAPRFMIALCAAVFGWPLERVPSAWTRAIEKDSLKIQMLEHVLIEKPLRAFSGHALAAAVGGETNAAKPAEPAGYRLSDYRAPVPATLKGAKVLDTARAAEIWQARSAVFIDALPRPPKPEGLPKDAVWREQPRFDIPGSVWLPDTGYGELAAPTQRYFERGLARASGGDKKKPLVFYCLADCWMSWNAAKRAMRLGYANVSWYPDGTDGWAKDGRPLEERKPEPREAASP